MHLKLCNLWRVTPWKFWILLLDRHGFWKHQISKGSITATHVDSVCCLSKPLLTWGCAYNHNHPSACQNPDVRLRVEKLKKKAGITLDIKVLDHLIVLITELL
jgi:DNA repair protein RadC